MSDPMPRIPTLVDVQQAKARIAPHAWKTPVLQSEALDAVLGARVQFKCENLQRIGAFKFRGACNAVFALDEATARRGVVTQSSGNHGAALALAARLRGIDCHVVVPEGAPAVKLANIANAGARIVRCAANMGARDAATAALVAETGGTLVHPFDNTEVVAGQGTAALELIDAAGPLDVVIAPVGGGGLLSGTTLAITSAAPAARVWGAEPEGARDAHDSLAGGVRLTDRSASTIADGLRGYLGRIGFSILGAHRVPIVLVSEAEIVAAMRQLWEALKLVVEPSSAVAWAGLLKRRDELAGQRVGVILSGGNVDLDALPWSR